MLSAHTKRTWHDKCLKSQRSNFTTNIIDQKLICPKIIIKCGSNFVSYLSSKNTNVWPGKRALLLFLCNFLWYYFSLPHQSSYANTTLLMNPFRNGLLTIHSRTASLAISCITSFTGTGLCHRRTKNAITIIMYMKKLEIDVVMEKIFLHYVQK